MKSTLWKLTALAGVIGAGFLVVYQAQVNLMQRPDDGESTGAGEFQPLEGDVAESGPGEPAALASLTDLDQPRPADAPPEQGQKPEVRAESEPTLAEEWSSVPEEFNPFAPDDASSESSPPEATDQSPPPRSRFAELVASFSEVEVPESDPAPPEPAASVEPAGDAYEPNFGDFTQVRAQPPGPSSDPNPFFTGDSGFDAADAQPIAQVEPTADQPTEKAVDEPQTVASRTTPAEDAKGAPEFPSLARLDAADEGPSLIAPPVDATTETERPAGAPKNTPGGFRFADEPPAPNASDGSLDADPFAVAQTSNEQPADGGGAPEPFLILPGGATPTAAADSRSSSAQTPNRAAASSDPYLPGRDAPRPDEPDPFADSSSTVADADDESPFPPRNQQDPIPTPQKPVAVNAPSSASPAETEFDPFGDTASHAAPRETGPKPPPGSPFADSPLLPSSTTPSNPAPVFPGGGPTPAPRNPAGNSSSTEPSLSPSSLYGVGTVGADSPIGTQQAQVTIEKEAPPDAVIGKPLIYSIHVRNIGRSPAENVVVKDVTPKGSKLVGTSPQATLDESDGKLIWSLGRIDSGELRTIKVKVVPTDAGSIGSIATVSFEAAVAARTVVTAPDLRLAIQGPDEVGVGEKAAYKFTLTNAGAADATGVYIRNLIPEGFQHPRGNDLEYDVGTLRRGQSKDVELTLLAVNPGEYPNRAVLAADGDVEVQAVKQVVVLASRITLRREGPADRFVGREARFANTVANQSSKPLAEVTVVETVPPGLQFEDASDGGVFDPQRRTVTWRLRQLQPGASRPVYVSLIPLQAAEQSTTVRAFDAQGHSAEITSQLRVAGFSSLKIDVAHDGAPVPVGEDVALRLTIKNRGTAPATKVRTLVEIPQEMRFVDAKGPVRYTKVGSDLIEFEVDSLGIDGEQQFDIIMTAAQKGDARVRVELQSAELSSPLNQEELVVIHPFQE